MGAAGNPSLGSRGRTEQARPVDLPHGFANQVTTVWR